MNSLKINKIIELKSYFKKYFGINNLKKNTIETRDLYNFAATKKFKILYEEIINKVVKINKFDLNYICIQPVPTFRKYVKNAHGTSFHNDYLYGHGKDTITVWVPLFGLEKKNSIYFLNKDYEKKISNKMLSINYSKKIEEDLMKNSEIPNLQNNEIIIFNSKKIHGSPKNISNRTRYSLDFRISNYKDKTSTKKIYNYLYLKNKKWKKKDIFKGNLFLKYVRGGKNADTTSQHIIIEGVAKQYGLNIVGQEAEIERHGFEILMKNIKGKFKNKEYNSIIIASTNILSLRILRQIKDSRIKVYSALEGKFLS